MSERTSSALWLRYSVHATIAAPAGMIWSRLTDAKGFAAWNSTVSSVEGEIVRGGKLKILVPIAPGRAFKPTVTELEAPRRMVWRDGFFPLFQGTRTFTLAPRAEGTDFTMEEEFRGVLLPLIRGSLPDFGPVFDRYAADLTAACER